MEYQNNNYLGRFSILLVNLLLMNLQPFFFHIFYSTSNNQSCVATNAINWKKAQKSGLFTPDTSVLKKPSGSGLDWTRCGPDQDRFGPGFKFMVDERPLLNSDLARFLAFFSTSFRLDQMDLDP